MAGNVTPDQLEQHLRSILTPELLLSVYRLKLTCPKNDCPDGNIVGHYHFDATKSYIQSFYDLIFHQALVPLSKVPFDATMQDYACWWIRILNSHIAITDICRCYPYWIRWKGVEYNDRDREFMHKVDGFRYKPEDDPVLQQVRQDSLDGVWQPLPVNPEYEKD